MMQCRFVRIEGDVAYLDILPQVNFVEPDKMQGLRASVTGNGAVQYNLKQQFVSFIKWDLKITIDGTIDNANIQLLIMDETSFNIGFQY